MLTLFSPAKLNLFLRILYRRPDGFHQLASLFQAISLGDTLHFSKTSGPDRLTAEGVSMPLDQSNLILKAAELFRSKTQTDFPIEVHVKKKIPLEAGLGGGSSNAATALWAMNELSDRPATLEQLVSWGGELGSDVAFFLSLGTAFCTGRGEVIQPLDALPKTPELHIIKPSYGASTPAVYKALKVAELANIDPAVSLQSFYSGTPVYYNDLEEAAFTVAPSLRQLKADLMHSGFEQVLLAGSGSSFFCFGDNGNVPKNGCFTCRANYIRRNPLKWYEPSREYS